MKRPDILHSPGEGFLLRGLLFCLDPMLVSTDDPCILNNNHAALLKRLYNNNVTIELGNYYNTALTFLQMLNPGIGPVG